MPSLLVINPGDNPNEGRVKINYNFSLISLSGDTIGDYLPLSGGTVSGTTNFSNSAIIQSGGTNLYSIFSTISSSGDVTRVQPGLNIYTGGTGNLPTVNISAATLTSLSATTLSGGTIFSGSTNLQTIIDNIAASHSGITGSFLALSGGTVTGDTLFSLQNNSASIVSSGNTMLRIKDSYVTDYIVQNDNILGYGISGSSMVRANMTNNKIAGVVAGNMTSVGHGEYSSEIVSANYISGITSYLITNFDYGSTFGYSNNVTGADNKIIINTGGTMFYFSAGSYTFPLTSGLSNQVMVNNGSGQLSWGTAIGNYLPISGGTVTGNTIFSVTTPPPTAGSTTVLGGNITISGTSHGIVMTNVTNSRTTLVAGTFTTTGASPSINITATSAATMTLSAGVTSIIYLSGSSGFITISNSGINETYVTTIPRFITAPASAETVSISANRSAKINLINGSNLNLKLSGFTSGNTGNIMLIQGSSGNSTVTLTGASYNNYVVNGGGGVINLTQSANAVDIISYFTDGTNVYWSSGYNYT